MPTTHLSLHTPGMKDVYDFEWEGDARSTNGTDIWTLGTHITGITLTHASDTLSGKTLPHIVDPVTGAFPGNVNVLVEKYPQQGIALTTMAYNGADPTLNVLRTAISNVFGTDTLVYDPATGIFTGSTGLDNTLLLYPDSADNTLLRMKATSTSPESTGTLSIVGDVWVGSVTSDELTLQASSDGLELFHVGWPSYGAVIIDSSGNIDGGATTTKVRSTYFDMNNANAISIRAETAGVVGTLKFNPTTELWAGSVKDSDGNFMLRTVNGGESIEFQASPAHTTSSLLTLKRVRPPHIDGLEDHSDYILVKAGYTLNLIGGTHYPVNRAINITIYGGGGGAGGGHGGSGFFEGESGGPGGAGSGGGRRAWNYKANELEVGSTIVVRVGRGGLGGQGGSADGDLGYAGTTGTDSQCTIYDTNAEAITSLYGYAGAGGNGGTGRSWWLDDRENHGANGESTSPPFEDSDTYSGEGGKGGYTYHYENNGGDGGNGGMPGAGGGAGGGGGWENDLQCCGLGGDGKGGRGGHGGIGGDGICMISWGPHRNYDALNPEQFPPNYRDNEFDENTRFKNYQIAKMMALTHYKIEYIERYEAAVIDGNVFNSGDKLYRDVPYDLGTVKCYNNMPRFGTAVELRLPGMLEWLQEDMGMSDEDIDSIAEANASEGIDLIEAYYLNNFLFDANAVQISMEYMATFCDTNGIVKLRVVHKAWGYSENSSVSPPPAPYARSLFEAVDMGGKDIAKSNYNRPINYLPYDYNNTMWVRSIDCHSEDIPALEFLRDDGTIVYIDTAHDYIRGAAYAMLIIARDGPQGWLNRVTEPRILGTAAAAGAAIPIITEEIFSMDFDKWISSVQLYNFDLASSAEDDPTAGEVARSFYMTDDFKYHHVYATLFWMLRDQAIRGPDGPFAFSGGTYNVGNTPASGQFYLIVARLANDNIVDTVGAVGQLFNIKFHEHDTNWVKTIILGIAMIIAAILIAIYCTGCLTAYLEGVSTWVAGLVAGATGMAVTTAAVVVESAYTAYEAYSIATSLIEVNETLSEGEDKEREAIDKDRTKVEDAEILANEKELERKREEGFDFISEEEEELKEEMDPFYKMEKENKTTFNPAAALNAPAEKYDPYS